MPRRKQIENEAKKAAKKPRKVRSPEETRYRNRKLTPEELAEQQARLDLPDDPSVHDQRRRACPYCLGSATLFSLGGDRAGTWKLTCANCSSVSYINSFLGRDLYRAWWESVASDPVQVQALLAKIQPAVKPSFDLAARPKEA